MEQKNGLRQLHLLRYLYTQTDDSHPASTSDIAAYLEFKGFQTHRQTIASEVEMLIGSGFDIISSRSRQNQYSYGARHFELAELKMMVDAIQAARFITERKSQALIEKLAGLVSVHEAKELNRQLYTAGRVKATNESILYTVDLLYEAIVQYRRVRFQCYEFTAEKKKVLKHKGKIYEFSPYDLAWCNDIYYVFGFSENHKKVVKFRVDRIYKPEILQKEIYPKPEDYDLPAYIRRTFSMYDTETYTVELKCENSLMKAVIDRFGEDVPTRPFGCAHFIATAEVSVSPTFFAWVFTFGGKIQIMSPKDVVEDFTTQLNQVLNAH